MNFSEFILRKGGGFLKPINARDVSAGKSIDFTIKNGVSLIYGNGIEIFSFRRKLKKEIKNKSKIFFKTFFIIGGDIHNIKTALPLDSRRVFSAGLKAWSLSRFDSRKAKLFSSILISFDFIFFYVFNFIFKKQFCVIIDSEKETFFGFLSSKLSISKEQLSFSVYEGSKKLVFPVFNEKTGENLAYVKVYDSEKKPRNFGENEAMALNFLNSFSFESAESPSVIFSGYFEKNLINMISSKDELKNFKGIDRAHIRWIEELAEKTGSKKIFKDSIFSKIIKEEIGLMKDKLDKAEFGLIVSFYEKAVNFLLEKEFLFSFVNGEFDFHELLFNGKKNFVIDWEQSQNDFPPIFDVYNLILSDNVNSPKGRDYKEMHIKNITSAFFEGNEKREKMIGYFLRKWSISKKDAYLFFILFLIDRVYNFIFSGSGRDGEIILKFLSEMEKNKEKYEGGWIKGVNFV